MQITSINLEALLRRSIQECLSCAASFISFCRTPGVGMTPQTRGNIKDFMRLASRSSQAFVFRLSCLSAWLCREKTSYPSVYIMCKEL